jgi:hypothetical protein
LVSGKLWFYNLAKIALAETLFTTRGKIWNLGHLTVFETKSGGKCLKRVYLKVGSSTLV